ncbi:tetratricopeptide repeat protein [Burkholderia ambifaria]|uniref:tetratricopeptide repeat protein n=1 Tax=Burkholderia ambifaria TaxID=152480 RepID=UPI001E653930|nr:tetratricopeptide repeat protein [Burkholderia ambifaria]UEP23080.1 tetratricopeptide repeat protein [Burkholderia ambifaria]UEP39825.1 tetratricopeptide repeat protein [Burkholderia ambifaria]
MFEADVKQIEAWLDCGDVLSASRSMDIEWVRQSDDLDRLAMAARLSRMLGRYDDAQRLIDRTLTRCGDHVEALVEQARLAMLRADAAGADASFDRAYSEPLSEAGWVDEWISALAKLGKFQAIVRIAKSRCTRDPENAEYWFKLGLALQQGRQHEQALEAYAHVSRLAPDFPMLSNNRGAAYIETRNAEAAEKVLKTALEKEPLNALLWTNLCTALRMRGDIQESLVAGERACTLAPNYATAHQARCYVLKELQRWEEASAAIRRALACDPDDPSHGWSLAMLQLLRGEFEEGWRNHEFRWHGSPELRGVPIMLAGGRWDGESLKGKRLFVWSEQGFGDAIQFARLIPALSIRVRAQGGKLIYCCFEKLLPLLRRSVGEYVDEIVSDTLTPLPGYDFHIPVGSLPQMLETDVGGEGFGRAYLSADRTRTETWRKRCTVRAGDSGALKVGLVWSGSRTHARNPYRSVSPLLYADAFRSIENITFYSLQIDGAQEVEQVRKAGMRLIDLTTQIETYDDTAAFLSNLDLVITVCTSTAHLAGALGVPTWVLLDVNPHWVWMTDRSDSPWYSSIKLYRQRQFSEWTPVLVDMAKDLARLAAGRD